MRHHHLDANGVTLHAVELGTGPAVLFCHGFPDTWHGWRRQMEAVAAAGYRAIALDMRGYGDSSAPEDPALYTPFHTVGDLVAVLDALGVDSTTIVGHDFGASVAWYAAMMRPDRFRAVFALSVAYRMPGGPDFLQRLRDAGHHDFYMFRQMRPEADAEWADAAVTVPGMRYWTSGSAPASGAWDPFDPARGLNRPPPAETPAWMDGPELADTVRAFERTGFRGALNHYRAIPIYSAMNGAFAGVRIRQPSCFLTGAADGLTKVQDLTEVGLRESLPGLRGFVALDGVGHWPQHEAVDAVNEAILGFLSGPG